MYGHLSQPSHCYLSIEGFKVHATVQHRSGQSPIRDEPMLRNKQAFHCSAQSNS